MPQGANVSISSTKGNPVYEYIKKEDIEGAFRDALNISLSALMTQINTLISLYAATAPPSLWTWDHTARWGYDKWWTWLTPFLALPLLVALSLI